MATSIEMPELGESVTEGTITTWLKKVGDTVEVDEPLLEVSTDKVDTEIPSPVAGVLLEILAEEDDTVDVGAVIATIGEEGETPSDSSSDDSKEEAPEEEPAEEPEAEESTDEAPAASGDATDVTMPELGESVTEGTITSWLKKVGDTVEVDEPLLEVSTDKVDTEIPSPVAGTLVEILAEEDDTVDVGAVIARVGEPGSARAKSEPKEESAEEPDEAVSEDDAEKEAAKVVAAEKEPEEAGSDDADDVDTSDAADVTMPELGESVTEGTITSWLKKVGDTVEVDEPLLEVSTDKVDTEIPSPVAGVLLEILADEDDTVDVGAVIAKVGSGSAKPTEAKKEEPKKEPKKEEPKPEPKPEPKKEEPKKEEPQKEAPKPAAKKEESANADVPYVTPLVRKLADKHGVDLTKVKGSGIGGRIRKQDVLKAAEGGQEAAPAGSARSTKGVRPEAASLRGTTEKVSRVREIAGAGAVSSLQATAQATQLHEADMTEVWELRAEQASAFESKHGVALEFSAFFAKAVVEALEAHPNVNASLNGDGSEVTYHEAVNLAVAVDTERGLLTPVVSNAQALSLPELAKAIADVTERAQSGKLKPQDLGGATFTITNVGTEGALADTPIVLAPQAAALATGAVTKRPVVVTENGSDAIGIRAIALLPLSYDYRLVSEADAARFMSTVVDRLNVGNFADDLEV